MTASQVAHRCDFPASQIAMYESGARTPDIIRLRRWAYQLGVTIQAVEVTRMIHPQEKVRPSS